MNQIQLNNIDHDKILLIKRTVCVGASDDELKLFLHVCTKTGLDPFMKQIYAIKRAGKMCIQTSIDGFRLIADRTGCYAPGRETQFVSDDNGNLLSCTAYIRKKTTDGTWHEVSGTAYWSEFNPGNNTFWGKMPRVMLSKCAEAIALRRAFPAELSSVYTNDEMQQADTSEEVSEAPKVFLDADQQTEIEQWLDSDAVLHKRVLDAYGVKSLSEIESNQFTKIVKKLQKTREMVEVS